MIRRLRWMAMGAALTMGGQLWLRRRVRTMARRRLQPLVPVRDARRGQDPRRGGNELRRRGNGAAPLARPRPVLAARRAR